MNWNVVTTLTFIFALTSLQVEAKSSAIISSKNACRSNESWEFNSSVHPKWQHEFNLFMNQKKSDPAGFSQALALRQIAQEPEVKTFAEYWISRSLYDAKLYHIAYNGFTYLASQSVTPENIGVHAAAVECLSEIQSKFPTLSLTDSVTARVLEYAKNPNAKTVQSTLVRAMGIRIRDLIAESRPRGEITEALSLLKGKGADEALAQVFWAARRGEHKELTQWGQTFLQSPSKSSYLERFTDPVHMLLARALYAQKRFDEASQHLKMIKKQSNELAHALSELSWAYLMEEKYREAVGTAVNLQTGGLRKTFSPEAPMVMSMAFNELCQYPRAIESIRIFKKNYLSAYKWLQDWDKQPSKEIDLYSSAKKFLRDQPAGVPDKIVSEWVRSPHFIARQDEINLSFDEKDASTSLGRLGDQEQTKMAAYILKFTRDFKQKYQLAKARLKPGQDLPPLIYQQLDQIRDMMTHYRRYRNAAPVWRTILASYEKQMPQIIDGLAKDIRREFASMNKRMLQQLQEIAENNYFIEVEIFNGASQDIIWKNAYPDYEKVAKQINAEDAVAQSKVWSWGNISFNDNEEGEIWEDELGSFKADIYDNCNNKEKYLDIKRELAMETNKKHKIKE